MSGIPEHLYKYRSWNEEFAKEIFIDNQFYVSSPSEFNDPFDCRAHFRKEIRVLSLSACPDSILMWGHYSGNHQGFCLKFRTGEGGMFDAAMPVNYSTRRPPVDYVKDPLEKRVKAVMFTKSNVWSYEEEWRIVYSSTSRSNMPKKYPFLPEALEGVIFGCRMLQGVKDKIKEWLGESRCKPRLYQAKIKDLEFGLDIVLEKG